MTVQTDKERRFHPSMFPSDSEFLICDPMRLCLPSGNGSLETCKYLKFSPLQLNTTSNCNQRRGFLCTYSMSMQTAPCFLSFISMVNCLFPSICYMVIFFSVLLTNICHCFFCLRYRIHQKCNSKAFCHHHIKDLV